MTNATKLSPRWMGLLVMGISLAVANQASAAFTVNTQVTNVSYSGGSLTQTSLTANTSYPIGNGSFTTGALGGSAYTDAAGTTVYFVEDQRTAGNFAVLNEQIFVSNNTTGATDTGTFTFNTQLTVIYNGSTGTFNEGPNSIQLNLISGNANYLVLAGMLTPPSQVISGTTFTSSLPQATSGNINSQNNGAISAVITQGAAVPEPASFVMLGMSTVALGGFMLRRRTR